MSTDMMTDDNDGGGTLSSSTPGSGVLPTEDPA